MGYTVKLKPLKLNSNRYAIKKNAFFHVVGYNKVVDIPAGAASIEIRQHGYQNKVDENYLGKFIFFFTYIFIYKGFFFFVFCFFFTK